LIPGIGGGGKAPSSTSAAVKTCAPGTLETKDDLLRRIEEASAHAPLDQLCLSPQCGFSSTVDGNALSYDEQVAKLALVVEVADEVWGR